MVVAVTLLDCLPTVGSVDGNGLFLIVVIFLHCISVIDGFPQLGVHPIAVFREEESYKSLKLAMSDICAEVKDLNLLTVAGETFQVKSYLPSNNA